MVVWCGTTQADQSALEKRHTTYPHQRMKTQSLALVLELLGRVNSMYVSELKRAEYFRVSQAQRQTRRTGPP